MIQIRQIHSKPLLKEAYTQLADYLQFFKTPKDLKPLVYRSKNASELISRDLWDPVQKKRILPLNPPQIPAVNKLTQVIQNVSTVDELNEVKEQMISLAYYKIDYTKSLHLINYLEKSAELRKFPHALTLIYSKDSLKHLIDSKVLNTILTFLYIQPSKSFENSIKKTEVALKQTPSRDQLTNLLRLAIQLKFKPESSAAGLLKKISQQEPISLPKLDTTKAPGVSAWQLNKKRLLYLTLKPIQETVGQNPKYSDLENVVEISKFVKDYESIETKLNIPNTFNALKEKSLFGKLAEQVEETTESSEEASEEKA